ncbi:GNAT family N-acetyltransferase [Tabrizicola sp.]|uniref:GNAT family N-acetyltransferase n=1 Tax=Tabrizicola sp. TaxID=2005166 RepID=UPI003F37FCE6
MPTQCWTQTEPHNLKARRLVDQPGTVKLRAPLPEDIDARIAHGFSAEIRRMYGYVGDTPREMARADAEHWLQQLEAHPCAWVIETEEGVVGGVSLNNINETDRRARLAIGLFNERHLGRGIGREAIKLVLQHAFGPLGLHRVDLRVLAYNLRAIRCYEACGFVREGIERESARVGDEWHDDWIMAILEQDFWAAQAAN